MAGFDLSTITGCYVGSTPASAIYYGSDKIWPATPHDYSQDYFTIVSLDDDNDITFSLFSNSDTPSNISVSTDGGSTWVQYTSSYPSTVIGNLDTGEKLLLKSNRINSFNFIRSVKTINVEGNIMSLIYGDNFVNQTALTIISQLANIFSRAPIVSAQNLILPATTLTTGCYAGMFQGCTSLTAAPALPATTLASSCYASMFSSCTSLTTAPELLATTLANYCYEGMFEHCSSLNYIKCLATDISASGCLRSWVFSVSPTGTFIKDANTTWPLVDIYKLPSQGNDGAAGIPNTWTVQNA